MGVKLGLSLALDEMSHRETETTRDYLTQISKFAIHIANLEIWVKNKAMEITEALLCIEQRR